MKQATRRAGGSWARWCRVTLVALGFTLPARVHAAPNLVANGDLEQPRQAAESWLSPTENEVIFEIPGPQGFGRVVARGPNAGRDLQKGLKVGYTQIPGTSRGLLIDAREVKVTGGYEITVWFDLRGEIRPNRRYAYSVTCQSGEQGQQTVSLEMIAPAIWADGKLMGTRLPLSWPSEPKTYDDLTLRGIVKTPDFKHQTGGQFLVLKLPQNFASTLYIVRVSFRELDDALLSGKDADMPTPTRYLPVDDILEEDVADALQRSTEAIQNTLTPAGYWQAGAGDDTVSQTAWNLDLLARRGVDLKEVKYRDAIKWLSEQEPTATAAVASRLTFFSRHGREDFRQTIAKDLLRLINAQFDDGGWNESAADKVQDDRKLHSANVPTLSACLGLYEAHYAGFKAEAKTWRKAAAYWREAQARDGGYRAMMDSYGGLGEATTTQNTACGLAGLLITLDMAFADGASRCTQYLSNTTHREGVQRAIAWMDEYYDEYYKKLARLDAEPDPFLNAGAMLTLLRLSGIRRFHDKDIFRTEAENIMQHYDPTSGLFAGSIQATGYALFYLNEGAAPTVFNRLILGGTDDYRLSRDAAHLSRYLIDQRKKPLNWAEVTLETPIEGLVDVPILYVHVAGEQEVTDQQWRLWRDYCFAGGVIVYNIAEDYPAGLARIEAGLKTAFPEYTIKELAENDPFWSAGENKLAPIKGLRVVGNGLKQFVFILPHDWSCRLNTFKLTEHPETFKFFDHLMTYTLDGEEPRSSFAYTTWDHPSASNSKVRVAHLEVGADLPAYPDLMATLDRRLRSEYRLDLEPVPAEDTKQDATLLWLSCAGPKPMTDAQRQMLAERIKRGTYIFAEVLTGNGKWAETFRSDLQKVDDKLTIRKLPANHPLLTGRLHETYGYDVRVMPLRRALREENEKLPRLDAYVIEREGEDVGMLSVHDVGSGLGYVFYPECRGAMPRNSRELAANIVLYALQRQLELD